MNFLHNGDVKPAESAAGIMYIIPMDRYDWEATIETGPTPNFVSEELTDNLAALGRITRTRRQVRLADGSGGQLKVEVKFSNKDLTVNR